MEHDPANMVPLLILVLKSLDIPLKYSLDPLLLPFDVKIKMVPMMIGFSLSNLLSSLMQAIVVTPSLQ